MNDDSNHSEITSIPPDPAGSTPLDHVIDDVEPKEAWGEWAVQEMTKGRSPEELSAEMVAGGWGEDDAAEMVEAARRRTRHLRGVVTRDDVARENAARYRKATALNWFTAVVSIATAWRLLNSLAFLLSSRRRRPTKAAGFPAAPSSDTATARPGEPSAEGPNP